MTTADLENYLAQNGPLAEQIEQAFANLFRHINRAAVLSAELNASWHDDPSQPDHAAHHAPPEVQYPAEVRREVLINIIKARPFTL